MNIPLIRRFGLPLVLMAAAAVLLAGCNDSSPTEPKVAAAATTPTTTPTLSPTPLPPGGNIAGAWTGTYNATPQNIECEASINFPAQAAFEQDGSTVRGTLSAPGPCGLGSLAFTGTLKGTTLAGIVTDNHVFEGSVDGILSVSTLEVSASNSYGFTFCQLHLHR